MKNKIFHNSLFFYLLSASFFLISSCAKDSKQKQAAPPPPNADHIRQVHILKLIDTKRDFPFSLPDTSQISTNLRVNVVNHYIKSPEEAKKLLRELNGAPIDVLISTQKELNHIYSDMKLPRVKTRKIFFVTYPGSTPSLKNFNAINFNPENLKIFEKALCSQLYCDSSWYQENKHTTRPSKKTPSVTLKTNNNTSFEKEPKHLYYELNWEEIIFTLLNSAIDKIDLNIQNGFIKLNYSPALKKHITPIILKQINTTPL